MFKYVEARIEGTRSLLMHNGLLSDPLSLASRKIRGLVADKKSKRKSGDLETEWILAEAEWRGGLWLDESGRPALLADAVEGAIRDGAKADKRGKAAAGAVRCVDHARLEYDGPESLDELFAAGRKDLETGRISWVDRRTAKVAGRAIQRTRPRFPIPWAASFRLEVDTVTIPIRDVQAALVEAGERCGIGDYRPSSPKGGKFGLFSVTEFKECK